MNMSEKIPFTYSSFSNLIRLLCDVFYESHHSKEEICVYHERFKSEPDSLFFDFISTLFPDGCTVGEKELSQLCNYIDLFLEKDELSNEIRLKRDLENLDSYVYFDIDKKIYLCEFCSHANVVRDICIDYFSAFEKEDLTVDMVENFIVDHFVVKSSFSSAKKISKDAFYIFNCILFGTNNKKINRIL